MDIHESEGRAKAPKINSGAFALYSAGYLRPAYPQGFSVG